MKVPKIILLFLLVSSVASAQVQAGADEPSASASFPPLLLEPLFYFLVSFAAVLTFVLYVLARSIRVLSRKLAGDVGQMPAVEKAVTKSGWQRLMAALTRSVPVAQEKDVLLDHNYDGIMELDNKLPPWWIWGFYITIIFSFVYIFYYHVSDMGKLSGAEYTAELMVAEQEKAERMKLNANNITRENVTRLTEGSAIAEGAMLFSKNCVACHGDKGQGGVGPNLADSYWIHSGGIKNIFQSIAEGIPSKGMISWKAQLSPKQIQQVSSYIMTLEGTNPPGGKEPQGDLYKEVTDTLHAITVTDSLGRDSTRFKTL